MKNEQCLKSTCWSKLLWVGLDSLSYLSGISLRSLNGLDLDYLDRSKTPKKACMYFGIVRQWQVVIIPQQEHPLPLQSLIMSEGLILFSDLFSSSKCNTTSSFVFIIQRSQLQLFRLARHCLCLARLPNYHAVLMRPGS